MSRTSGSRYLADAFRRLGVSHVFLMPTILMQTMAELDGTEVRRVTTHGEKAAAYMADGYARASRSPGFCMTQGFVGAGNLVAGLREPMLAHSPVVAMSGGPNMASRYRHAYQDNEDFGMFDHVTKFNAYVEELARFPDIFAQAMRCALSGTPGPVHLALKGSHGQVLEREEDLGSVDWLQTPAGESGWRVPLHRPEPDAEAVQQAARLLAQAERPVMVAGLGVRLSDAAAEARALAERFGIPVATTLNGKGTIPDDHPLAAGVVGRYSRRCANQVVAAADLVLFAGSRAGNMATNDWRIPRRGTPVIHLGLDPEHLGRNYPARVSVLGDARRCLERLARALGEQPQRDRSAWHGQVAGLVAAWRSEVAARRDAEAAPIRPERLCRDIGEALPDDALLVADTGHSGVWTGTMLDLRSPGQEYIRSCGTLGWALPASLGAKCALPDRPVVCFTGDGGFYYHISELETAARHRINAVIVVNDNHALNQEQRLVAEAYGGQLRDRADELWVYTQVDFAQIARDMGCLGIRVEEPRQIRPALEKALAAERPVVLDVVTDISALHDRAWA